MNDYLTIMAILDKAHIPYTRDVEVAHLDMPPGSFSLDIRTANQPNTLSYNTAYASLVFGPDRNLIAIWTWE